MFWDVNGNLIQKAESGITHTYEYDAQGRLTVDNSVWFDTKIRVDRTYNENGLLSGAVQIYDEQHEVNRFELYYKQIFVDAGQSEVLEAQREYIPEWIVMLRWSNKSNTKTHRIKSGGFLLEPSAF